MNQPESPTPATEAWRRYNILIVDDDPKILKSLKNALSIEGFSITTASSGEEGLKVLETLPAKLVISDQVMPGGMSGTEFLCKVKDHYPDTITMILSAYTEPEYILDAMNKSRTFYYLTKPWEDKILLERINEALKYYHAGFMRKERERHAHAIMIESEKMANLGNYVAGIAHNLRNMVFPFVACFDVFREDLTELRSSDKSKGALFESYTKEMLDMTEQGQQSVDQITSLVDSMMALCRSNVGGEAETFDLAEVVKSAICLEKTQKTSKVVDIHLDTKGIDFNLLALRGVVSSMIMEFLKNAKYAILERAKVDGKEPRTGNIWVSLQEIKDDEFGEAIRLSVKDDGCGMSAEVRKEIFTPLFTTKKDIGTGLGLSFAYAIVQAHRGRIEVDSKEGHGTTFAVTLPKTSDKKIELLLT